MVILKLVYFALQILRVPKSVAGLSMLMPGTTYMRQFTFTILLLSTLYKSFTTSHWVLNWRAEFPRSSHPEESLSINELT